MFARFRRSLLTLALAVFPMAAQALGPLVDVEGLRAALAAEAPVVLDIRAPGAYEKGHVPGALNAPYGVFRGPAENPGQLVTEAHLTEVLRGLGLRHDTPVVVVHQGTNQTDFGAAARVYWTLKSSGIAPLAILNGGMNAWLANGTRTVQKTGSTPSPSDFTVTLSDRRVSRLCSSAASRNALP